MRRKCSTEQKLSDENVINQIGPRTTTTVDRVAASTFRRCEARLCWIEDIALIEISWPTTNGNVSHAATVSIRNFRQTHFAVQCALCDDSLTGIACDCSTMITAKFSTAQHQHAYPDWPTILKYQIKNNANEHMSKHITLLRLSKLNQILLIYI